MGGRAVHRGDVSRSSTDFFSLLALTILPDLHMQMNTLSSTLRLDFRPGQGPEDRAAAQRSRSWGSTRPLWYALMSACTRSRTPNFSHTRPR